MTNTPTGWLCPRCSRVNAPWLPCCDCVAVQAPEPARDPIPGKLILTVGRAEEVAKEVMEQWPQWKREAIRKDFGLA